MCLVAARAHTVALQHVGRELFGLRQCLGGWQAGIQLRKIGRRDAHHHACVGIALGARILAHAVGHHAARLAGGSHHGAAWAHTEAVHGAPIAGMVHQLVIGRAQQRVAGMHAPARLVDQALRVLDAKADRERLGLHLHATLVQHGEAVACAVTKGEDGMAGGQHVILSGSQIVHMQRLQRASGVALDIGHALLETDLAAQRLDLFADAFHYLHQAEGADMRACHVEDFFRRAGLDELFHHLAAEVARVLDLAVELAVTESAGAAFAKLHVAFGREHLLAPQAPGVLGALAHLLATLQHDGLESHLRQRQRGQHAAGAEADHHRALREVCRGVCGGVPAHVRRGLDVGVAGVLLQQSGHGAGGVIGQRHIDDEHLLQLLLARIEAALVHVHLGQIGGGDAQGVGHGLAQVGIAAVQRQADFGESDHDGLVSIKQNFNYRAGWRGCHHSGIMRSVKPARPPLVQSWKHGTGGTSGLHRTAQEVTPLHRKPQGPR